MGDTTMEDFKDWVIAYVGGTTFIGKLHSKLGVGNSLRLLDPVYALAMSIIGNRDTGQIKVIHEAQPPFLLPSFKTLEIEDAVTTKRVDELSANDQRKLRAAIDAGEKIVASMRASEAGITIARG